MRARVNVSSTSAVWARQAGSISGAVGSGTRPPDDARGEASSWRELLDRYVEGWAEANPIKIFAATAHGYQFDDPLVGQFSRWCIPVYFEYVRERFARAGACAAPDFAFSIHGPIDGPPRRGRLTFFREAPRLGLTGVTLITIGERGVIAEVVAYDESLALEVLRARSRNPAPRRA